MSQPVQTDPFVLYQSERLAAYADRLIHGFTGKPVTLGGPGFAPEMIRESRQAVCAHAGLNGQRLTLPRQTHTDRFRINDRPCEEETDAVILTEPDLPAMVQVADCVPVILYSPDRHIGAVIHAGWRGTAQGITRQVARCLLQEYGAAPQTLVAAIGPSIGGCCYEVSTEVAQSVGHTIPEPPEQWSFMNENGRPVIDLKTVNRLQLAALGVGDIEVLPSCTRCETETLWSFRRGENGRQVAFLQLQAR